MRISLTTTMSGVGAERAERAEADSLSVEDAGRSWCILGGGGILHGPGRRTGSTISTRFELGGEGGGSTTVRGGGAGGTFAKYKNYLLTTIFDEFASVTFAHLQPCE